MAEELTEITTDEEYNHILDDYENPVLDDYEHPAIIADHRPGKNIVICSLDFAYHETVLLMLDKFIKDRFDAGHGLPDKIYILKLNEGYLDMNCNFLSAVISKGFRYAKNKNTSTECIFINADLAVTSNVRKYLTEKNIHDDYVNCFGFPLGLLSRTRQRLTSLNTNNKTADYNSTPSKHFICLNANSSVHRTRLVTWLHETNIIDKCHWSWLRRNDNQKDRKEWEDQLDLFKFTNTSIFNFRKTKELDMTVDELTVHINQDKVDNFYYLTDSLIDIGVETSPADIQFITEKTWKPYLHGKVSLFFNCQSYYAILNNLGFELYDEIFDYSFDTIIDTDDRQLAYQNELKRISEIPIKDLQKKIISIKDKIERNRNHAWNCDMKTFSIFKEYPMLLL